MLAERRVDEVGGAVVPLDVPPPRRVHRRRQLARLEPVAERPADHRPLPILPHRVDRERPALAAEMAGVAHLPARLDVERVLAQQQLDAIPRLPESEHFGVRLVHGVPDEFLLPLLHVLPFTRLVRQDRRPSAGDLRQPHRARPAPLRLERLLEPGEIHRRPRLVGDDLGQVDREAERVVELERLVAADHGDPALEQLVHPAESARHRLEEALFFDLGEVGDVSRLGAELRVDVAQFVDHDLGEGREGRLAPAEEPGVADGATEDAAEDIAATVVGRVDAVGHQEGDRARVVGEDAIGSATGAAVVWLPDQRFDSLEEGEEEVGVEVRVLALQHCRDPLEPGAGIDRGLRQGRERPVGRPVELHEDEVPDLEEASFLGQPLELFLGNDFLRPCATAPLRLPLEVDVDLAAGPARTGVPHLPEVVLVRQPVDPVIREARRVAPELPRFGVRMMDRDPDPLGIDAQPLLGGHEFPGELDRVLLEVIAEGEVPQHLEEGVVPLGVAHLFEVVVLPAGAHALLGRGGPGVVAVLLPQEGALELHHPGIGEQERRVVGGNERAGRHLSVGPLGEVVEELPADQAGVHIV